jgi:DNA-directed RNA polymerase specialized sigma24 family protein
MKANPERECAQREREGILREAIRDLRPAVREVVDIQQLQEFSLKDTAGMIGISVSATKARPFHGKAALRRELIGRINRNGLGRRRFQRFGYGMRKSGMRQ